MAIVAKSTGNSKPIPAGLHHAICTAVYDLGTQWNERYQKGDRKVLIQWELPGVRIEIDKDGEKLDLPRATSRKFTLSLHEKSHLRPFLEGWRGKTFTGKELLGFDILSVLGVNCLLQIIHKEVEDKTYANVTSALPLQQGTEKKTAENPLRSFSVDDDNSPSP